MCWMNFTISFDGISVDIIRNRLDLNFLFIFVLIVLFQCWKECMQLDRQIEDA